MPLSTLRGLLALLLSCLLLPVVARPISEAPDDRTLEFVENKGQWPAQARYMAELPAGRLFLENTGFTYAFVDPKALLAHHDHVAPPAGQGDKLRAHAYSVTFEGGNANPIFSSTEATAGRRNYFLGKDPSAWASNVAGFRAVSYAGVYAGIGVQLYENQHQQLEYDFTVAPGAQPASIRLRYEGTSGLRVQNGQLLIQTSVGTVQEQTPQAWQLVGEKRVPVTCAFVLQDNVVSFRLGHYDPHYALVIDPTVIFASFTGSTADNWGFTATYDAQGNMYSGGIVFGAGYPTTTGAYDLSFSGNEDIGIIKYNTAANGAAARLYATYLGGSQADVPHSLVVNKQGELVILGSTGSANFPITTGAYDASFNGGPAVQPFPTSRPDAAPNFPNGADLFVAKLNATGTALTGATFLGGSGTDGLQVLPTASSPLVANYGDEFRGDVITDADGNIYLASTTSSTNFPTPNGFRTSYQAGTSDAVVCKLSADLRQLLWSTYLGGIGADGAYSIQLDGSRNVYVCGGTTSTNFPTTSGSYQPTARGGVDGFVARLSSTGNTLQRATYLGTSAYDQTYFLQLDGDMDVYLLGQTKGNFPVSPGLYSKANGRQFIQKMDNDLSRSLYSTTFGSGRETLDLSLTAFLVDDCERVYVSGWGGSTNHEGSTAGLPVTPNAAQDKTDGSDFYLAEFTAGLTALEYATYYGQSGGAGEHVDGGTSRFDKRGVVYQAVCGGCRGAATGFPIPPGANTYSTTNKSDNCNNASFKIDFGKLAADPGPSRYVCANAGPITLGGTPGGGVWSGPGVTAVPGGYRFTPSANLLGRNTLTYVVATAGICLSTKTLRMTVTPVVPLTFTALPAVCREAKPLTLTASPPGGTFSGPGVNGSMFNPTAAGLGTHTLTYSFADSVTCGTASQTVVVTELPTVRVGPDTTLCADQTRPFQLRAAVPAGGVWSGAGVTASGLFTPPATNNRGGIFLLRYTAGRNGCDASAVQKVVLAPTSARNVPLEIPVCQAAPQYTGLAPFNCQFAPLLTGGTYLWDFGDQTTSTEEAPLHLYATAGTYPVKLTARYANCVVETQFAPVDVGEVFVPNIITPNNDGLNEQFITRFSCQPATLRVFSRWGTKVYETDNYRNDWRADNLADGVYYYHLRDAEGRAVKGWLEVKRQ